MSEIGWNYLSRTDADADKMTLLGVDLAAKWRQAGVLSAFLQGELWLRTKQPANGSIERTLGAYVVPQYAFDSQLMLSFIPTALASRNLAAGFFRHLWFCAIVAAVATASGFMISVGSNSLPTVPAIIVTLLLLGWLAARIMSKSSLGSGSQSNP